MQADLPGHLDAEELASAVERLRQQALGHQAEQHQR